MGDLVARDMGISRPIQYASAITVSLGGQTLLTLRRDGTVEAPSLEAASEAGRVFVESVRGEVARIAEIERLRARVAELEGWKAAEEAHHKYLVRRVAELEAMIGTTQ